MSNGMNVDPVHLRLTGRSLRSAATDAHAGFRSSTSRLGETAGGLFSSTRSALTDKADAWHRVTSTLTDRVGDHAGILHIDAGLYEQADGTLSTALHDAASDLGRRHQLNLES